VSVPTTTDRPGLIEARPVRHPWRWVAIAIIALLFAMMANLIFTNPAFDWSFVFKAMVQTPVLRGLYIGTLLTTALAMAVGVSGGILCAVMRLSDNPVLSGVAWLFTWFFRGIPRYVLLATMGTLGILFQQGGLSLGIPFDWKIQQLLGISGSWRFATLDANALFAGLFGAVLGLGLSEAAYMAEIARAGILSVDKGQAEAAEALGMSSGKSMRRIVLPQAMRVIVPPTGNETIAMVKDTSLLIALPLSTELFFQLSSIGSRTFKTFPAFVAASLWYLIVTSILMVGQFYLERYFGRGFGEKKPKNKRFARGPGMGGA
jgi:polar amino acid transport system permease protein